MQTRFSPLEQKKLSRRKWAQTALGALLGGLALPTDATANMVTAFRGKNGYSLHPSPALPLHVRAAVHAANHIVGLPYKWGGGHLNHRDTGYDCSGAVSFVLYHAGLSRGSKHCREYLTYGAPGRGRWITIWVNQKHVFLSITGVTFDTCIGGKAVGPRWIPTGRSLKGFTPRHIPGF